MNLRPSGYEPDELPGCSTPRWLVARGPLGGVPASGGVGSGRPGMAGGLCEERGALVRSGGDLLSRVYDGAVPSAVARLTAEFGMGSGVSRSLWPPDRIKAPWTRPALRGRNAKGVQHQSVCILRFAHRARRRPGGGLRGVVHAFPVLWRLGSRLAPAPIDHALPVTGSDQACWTISTGQLSALLRVHLRPIDVVVCHGPQGDLVSRGASRLDAFSGYPVRS